MKKKLLIILVILLFIGCKETSDTNFTKEKTITDDLRNKVSITEIPGRVISLAPNLTEMIFELGVGETLIGNTTYCNYPQQAKEITKVGDMLTIDYEKILELNPDLIFLTVEGNKKSDYNKLIELGLKVFVSNPRDFEGIKKTFSDMGKIFEEEKTAHYKIAQWDSTYNTIVKNSKELQPKSVMILIELNPLMLAGQNTFIDGYIEACNMVNFVQDSIQTYPVYSREIVLERKPDIIVYPSGGTEKMETILEVYPEWEDLPVINNNRVFFVDWDLYYRPGPRYVDALKDFYLRLTEN